MRYAGGDESFTLYDYDIIIFMFSVRGLENVDEVAVHYSNRVFLLMHVLLYPICRPLHTEPQSQIYT